jgi:hypothetical protein
MNTKVKKILIFLVSTSTSFVIAWFFTTYNKNLAKVNIVNDDFVTNLLGALLALSIAIITLVYSTIEKIHQRITHHPNKNNIEITINSLFSALKKDTWIVFVFLITIIVVILLRDTDVPYLTYPNFLPITKINVVFFVKIFVLFLSFIAVADIILCLFALIKVSNQR